MPRVPARRSAVAVWRDGHALVVVSSLVFVLRALVCPQPGKQQEIKFLSLFADRGLITVFPMARLSLLSSCSLSSCSLLPENFATS